MSRWLSKHERDSSRPVSAPEASAGKPPWWLWGSSGLLVMLALGFALWRGQGGGRAQPGAELDHFGSVPAFTLLERSGKTVGYTDLQGRVWVANFMFTRCVAECPLLSNSLAQLQGLLAGNDEVRLVSITVDPEYDTPEVLTRYAQSFAADPQRWLFLTGEKAAVYRLALEGFHLGVEDTKELRKSSALSVGHWFARHVDGWLGLAVAFAHHPGHATSDGPTVLHSARVVLVDRQGQIRKYYDGTEPESVRRMYSDIRRVLQER